MRKIVNLATLEHRGASPFPLFHIRSFLLQKPGFRKIPIYEGGLVTILYHNTVPYSMCSFTDLRTGSDTFCEYGT
ncbi:hypothetical protein GCM10027031_15480 [Corynebacterium atrinae]